MRPALANPTRNRCADEDEDPVLVLLEESDPIRRSAAHLTLGQRAMARQDVATARDHFGEAADLDPTDERPRTLLRSLGAPPPRRRGVLDFLFGR